MGCSLLHPGSLDISCSSASAAGSSGAGIGPSQAGEPAAAPHMGLHVLLGGPAHMSTHEGPPTLQWSWPGFARVWSFLLLGRQGLSAQCLHAVTLFFPNPPDFKKPSPDACLVKCNPCSTPQSYSAPSSLLPWSCLTADTCSSCQGD